MQLVTLMGVMIGYDLLLGGREGQYAVKAEFDLGMRQICGDQRFGFPAEA